MENREVERFLEESRRPLEELLSLCTRFSSAPGKPPRCGSCSTPTSPGRRSGAGCRRQATTCVRALDQEPGLEALADEHVLALASAESRILVTHNVHDFPAVLRQWAQADRSHAGVILVYGIGPKDLLVERGIEAWLQRRPGQADWRDYPAVLDRELANRPR